MAYSFVNYTGNGSTTSYSIPFTFIERDNVAVTVDGVSTTFSWVSDGQISISPAPSAATTIRIYRTTERNERLVDFSDGATLNAENLDTADLQNFYLAQETLDYSDVGVLTALVNDATASASAASDSEDAAAASSTAAAASASSAAASASTATTQATNAASSASAAAASAASIAAITTTKGDLVVRDASSTTRLPVGSNGQILVADSAETVGVKWATVSTSTVFNVKDYGALGDNSTNDYTAIAAAITALTANGGGVLYFPKGTYLVGSSLTITNVPFEISGDGKIISTIVSTSNTTLFSISQNSVQYKCGFRDLSLRTNQLGVGTAASVDYSTASITGTALDLFSVSNVEVRGTGNSGQAGFFHGFVLTDTGNCPFTDYTFIGYVTAASVAGFSNSGTGIKLLGANSPVEIFLTRVRIYYCQWAVEVNGSIEGLYINNCAFIQVGVGLYTHNPSANYPLYHVRGCHMSTFTYGIYVSHVGQVNFSDNLLYKSDLSTVLHAGIYTTDTYTGIISNNIFYDNSASGGNNPIVCGNNSVDIQVLNNDLGNKAVTGVWFQAGSQNCISKGNKFRTGATYTNVSVDSGTTNAPNGFRGALFYDSTNTSMTTALDKVITLDVITKDTDGFSLGGSNRITIPSNKGITLVEVTAVIGFSGNATGQRQIAINLNGGGVYAGKGAGFTTVTGFAGNVSVSACTGPIAVTGGDYFELIGNQNSGGSLGTLGSGRTWMALKVLG